MAFLGAVFCFVFSGILTVEDFLEGLANKQIINIFLLIVLTAGIQKNLGKGFFFMLFRKGLSAFQFRTRMMLVVSGLSSMLNNTPVVAFMIPFVKSWSESNGYSASKFLIPLSFATILGGMITVVGTSTNLVLNGLIASEGLGLLEYQDFLYLGLLVSVVGIAYLSFASEHLLPNRKGNKEEVIGQINEYLVETRVSDHSNLIGKSIEEAGLRHLKELFLVEIQRKDKIIRAVASEEIIQAGDLLFFAGNTASILNLINEKNGLLVPEESHIDNNGFSAMSEAIVPTGSNLIGQSLKGVGFRDEYKASVISIYRKGEKVRGNLGEIKLQAGDLLLMLCSKEVFNHTNFRNLILLSSAGEIESKISLKKIVPSLLAVVLLFLGIFGLIDLFLAAFSGILVMVVFKILSINQIKNAVDIDLLLVLISALAVGLAIQSSGSAAYLVGIIQKVTMDQDAIINVAVLFFVTLGLTTLITNAAAVSIMFPIAYELGLSSGGALTPYFVTIAFAASADFITPIGYQTNLMVMNPGNYKFSDYAKVGLPLTILYTICTLAFINFYYF